MWFSVIPGTVTLLVSALSFRGWLTVNLAKCEFTRATVTYRGHVVGQGEVCPVQAKVAAVESFPPPATKRELMRFLGLIGYYRSFCKNLSSMVCPLTDLLKDKVKFVWSSHCLVVVVGSSSHGSTVQTAG